MGSSIRSLSCVRALALVLLIALVIAPPPAHAATPLDIPDVTAAGVFAYDIATGETIYSANADERRPVGSLAKIMTALVTLDHRALDAEVMVTEADMVAPGYSTMWLQGGDTLTVEQLLTGVLLASGGDAARALARDIGTGLSGSDDPAIAVAAFVDAMNGRAADLGLTGTRFANPDGEDSADAWSTAHDVALMFGAVQEQPVLTAILAQVEYGFVSAGPERREYGGLTTNQLAGRHGITGAKTGSTEAAGGCLVLARTANQGRTTVIIALLGSNLVYDETGMQIEDDRWTDATTLIEEMDARWTWDDPDPDKSVTASLTPAGPATSDASVPIPAAHRAAARTERRADGDHEPFAIGLAGGMVAIASGVTWMRLRPGRS